MHVVAIYVLEFYIALQNASNRSCLENGNSFQVYIDGSVITTYDKF